jgi:cellulose synthase/poly-beta-1,6-N-acetylglucosamine synthase-like glycosyltransferase
MNSILIAAYAAASLGLFIYGMNCYVLLALYLRTHRSALRQSADVIAGAESRFADEANLPWVTTQIPIYNEINVAERAMRTAAAMDYPRDRHEIQVLDDSTDETCKIVDRVAAKLRAEGHLVNVLRRADRVGYKAGALGAGMRVAKGEFIAIFDADFVPPAHFLRHTLPFFMRDERMGLVQARWGHLNREDSLLTWAQAVGIDGHFMVEQSARTFNGLLMNFNGTAGVWRRKAIEDAGGWSADTLTEDLDLSYRAQLKGWHTHFLASLEVCGELPANIADFKSQQFRWAKGSFQTAIKLLPRIWRSPCPFWVKIQATLHLTHYGIHPLMLTVALLAFPTMVCFPAKLPFVLLMGVATALVAAMLAPLSMYFVSQWKLYSRLAWRIQWVPALMCVGVGLAVSNSRAIFEAILGVKSAFVRTPKRGDRLRRRYRVPTTILPWIEVTLGAYCAASVVVYFLSGKVLIGPFLIVYAAGFLGVGLAGLREARASAVAAARMKRLLRAKEKAAFLGRSQQA